MLILTRRVGETVMIGDEVTVTVLRVKGNQVRLGVNAPKSISVQREEIFQAERRDHGHRIVALQPYAHREGGAQALLHHKNSEPLAFRFDQAICFAIRTASRCSSSTCGSAVVGNRPKPQ